MHYPVDTTPGLATGRAVGAWTIGVFQRIAEDRGPIVMMMDRSMTKATISPHAVIGCALDNLSPVAAVTVRLDGGAPFNVAVNDEGLFTLPTDRIGPSGHHSAVVTATSATGRSSVVRVEIE